VSRRDVLGFGGREFSERMFARRSGLGRDSAEVHIRDGDAGGRPIPGRRG
jgi:hypothetical protein